ncbi:trypsin-like peptidase domain-containing protein [Rhizobium sp. P28RR-XV]|uniref:trypsin-like peptidase domain-containing protein n=1 Tax=Rhizobium sp. P28RR-XV TaxID=2726737 RepID=UPI0028B1CEBE|nr:trypsin-like peptidase domain-containing protein [Rhizobium sp. P28RR-XV]
MRAIVLTMGLTVIGGWNPAQTASLPLPSLAPILEKVIPSVVSISVRSTGAGDTNGATLPQAGGSLATVENVGPLLEISQTVGAGVIVDASNGYILTNNHVIENADDIRIATSDGSSYQGKVVGADAETDIAVIKIRAAGLTAAHIGDSSKLRVGDYVTAIGNPFGLGQTATFGIVSALGRAEFGVEGYQDIIQTDASLNPGDSGGALINLEGELVGINSAIIGPSGSNIGIGFAIPINTARSVMQQLVAHGEIRRGQLGVIVQNNNADFRRALRIDTATGALVSDVISGSGGAIAGIKAGDVIIAVNDVPIKSANELRARISAFPPNVSVRISLARPTGRVDLNATLIAALPQGEPSTTAEVKGHGLLDSVTVEKLGSDSDAYGKVEGAFVSSLIDSSKAAAAGLLPGDVIVSVNQHPASTPQMVADLTQKQDEVLLLGIFRDGRKLFLVIK